MATTTEAVQRELQEELGRYGKTKKEYDRFRQQLTKLDAQQNELNSVLMEFNLLKPDSEIFKLVGPILIKQDHIEAKDNVTKRLNFIDSEKKRVDDSLLITEKALVTHRETLNAIQLKCHEAVAASRQQRYQH